jgi:hypothetical protein
MPNAQGLMPLQRELLDAAKKSRYHGALDP